MITVEQILQAAVSPTILVSACGLLMLTMSNRMGRIVDRTRSLTREYLHAQPSDLGFIEEQIRLILSRARLIRTAIIFLTLCIFFVVLLIGAHFYLVLSGIDPGVAIATLFLGSLASLVVSLAVFMRELTLALRATVGEFEQAVRTRRSAN